MCSWVLGICSAPCLHVVQSFLGHVAPSQRFPSGNKLFREAPDLSTNLNENQSVGANLQVSSLNFVASSPFFMCSTNNTVFIGGVCSPGVFLSLYFLLPVTLLSSCVDPAFSLFLYQLLFLSNFFLILLLLLLIFFFPEIIRSKKILDQNYFGLNIVWIKFSLDPKLFWTKYFVEP